MDSVPTTTELKKLRVVDLKERLAKLGKSTSGLKADLIDRLYDALLEQAGNVDMGSHQVAGVAYPHRVDDLQPMNPEPPVVEVTIDTSQFDCGVVEPQIVTIEEYPIVENVGEVTIQSLHMDQMNEQDVGLYYQQQEEAERMQALLHRQQQEEELQRQQDEVERQRLQHEQILLQQRQQEEEELLRQRQIEEGERLRMEQEERIRWQQEELRRLQEEESRQQQQELLIAQEKAKEEERIRCQQIEEENRRRLEEEEAERQRQELERIRWQQEEEFRLSQEAEMLRHKQEMEERFRREQEEAERIRREEEAIELARQEAERIRREEEAAELARQEAEKLRREQEEAERIWREQEAEKIRIQEAERIRREQEAELIRMQQEEAELIRMQQEEADRNRREEEEKLRVLEVERIRQEKEAELARMEEERRQREHAEAERVRIEQERAEILRREQEAAERAREAERQRKEQEDAERLRKEKEEAERLRKEREEAERLRKEREEAERLRKEQEAERLRKEREEAERLRKEREEAERLRKEREEAERQRREREAERLRKEREEAELRRKAQQELLIKQREEENEKRKQEMERKKKEREQKMKEEEVERIRIKKLEAEEKERLHQEYLDKQTAAALIQIPVHIPAPSEGMLYHQPMVAGMTQPWPSVAQSSFPHQMVLPPPEGMIDGYTGNLLHPSEMTPMQRSASPPPIPGLGPPSHDKLDLSRPPALMSLDLHHPVDGEQEDDLRLPQALEKVLAYKMERAQMLGVDPDTIAAVAVEEDAAEDEVVDMEITATGTEKKSATKSTEPKPSKNKQRKLKKKKRARNRRDVEHIREVAQDEETGETEPDVEVQYIEDSLDLHPTDPMYHHFMKIFEAFKLTDPEVARREAEEEAARLLLESKKEPDLRKKPKDADEDLEEDNMKKEETPKLSKRKLKKLNRLSIAELKQHVNRPDVVEMHDVTAKDPRLLVILKSTRNTVPVPRHWCFKRKFLQGKRGIEKPPFNLPDFIKKTGIMEMRQALQEKEDQKTLKAKMRERVRPKMGKIDIDYQKLHDAFFKWQTKPKMTIHGDLYYEGKEFETRLKEKKPGELSDDLRTALGMPVGPNSQKVPPPWLIAMQRYGPPPSYPNLKIPGLNSPIPDGCSFGYHAGGWGKPPVDEMGKPLYGDVFGMLGGGNQQILPEEEVDRSLWGELESESESESEEEEEEEEEEEDEMELDDMDKSGFVTPAEGGLVTPSGISSIPMGMETPDMIELRKRKIESEMEGGDTPALYTILPEKKTDRLGGAMMGSTHIYDIAAAMPGRPRIGGANTVEGGVDVALDPSELDLDAATMTARYEQTLREQQNQLEKEDLSDMVAEHSAKQKNKRKRAAGEQHTGRAVKKYKDFKF